MAQRVVLETWRLVEAFGIAGGPSVDRRLKDAQQASRPTIRGCVALLLVLQLLSWSLVLLLWLRLLLLLLLLRWLLWFFVVVAAAAAAAAGVVIVVMVVVVGCCDRGCCHCVFFLRLWLWLLWRWS